MLWSIHFPAGLLHGNQLLELFRVFHCCSKSLVWVMKLVKITQDIVDTGQEEMPPQHAFFKNIPLAATLHVSACTKAVLVNWHCKTVELLQLVIRGPIHSVNTGSGIHYSPFVEKASFNPTTRVLRLPAILLLKHTTTKNSVVECKASENVCEKASIHTMNIFVQISPTWCIFALYTDSKSSTFGSPFRDFPAIFQSMQHQAKWILASKLLILL